MSEIVLKVENLWKQYRLGVMGAGTLRDDVDRFIAKLRGKEDPTLAIGSSNTLSEVEGDYVWALQEIDFAVKRGEVLGIIGKNGAGKSTLLKILSKVTAPTKGHVKIKGRVASLLEVGTGFHPELTGRENIFLNGAILGMNKAEIRSKLDEIIDFAGVAKYVDTPTKRYSSGMRVRLGFAVAAFLEPEILVVDEVLAVGDADFQKKAIGKMQDVSHGQGRTVLFVSHNMGSVRRLCDRTIVLKGGQMAFDGETPEGIDYYLRADTPEEAQCESSFEKAHDLCYIKNIKTVNNNGIYEYVSDKIAFEVTLEISEPVYGLFLGIIIEGSNGERVMVSSTDETEVDCMAEVKQPGEYKLVFAFPGQILSPEQYFVTFSLRDKMKIYHKVEQAISFEIVDNKTMRGIKDRFRKGILTAPVFDFDIV